MQATTQSTQATRAAELPRPFHLLAKPSGSTCNIAGATPLPPGEHQVRMEFACDGGGLGKGGNVPLYLNGKKDGEGRIDATLAMIFSADDGCDVGKDGGSAISPDYKAGDSAFNGKVKGVQLSIVGELARLAVGRAEGSTARLSPRSAARSAARRGRPAES